MNRIISILLIAYSMLLVSCRSELKNPHEIDPIYKAVHEQVSQSESRIATELKTIEDAQAAYDKTDPLTYQRVVARRDLEAAKRRLSSLRQENDYLKIRLKRREIEDKINYKIAFHANKEWPDPAEYEAYLVHERLTNASRSWSDRVPKLDDRIKAAWPKDAPKAAIENKEASAKEESGSGE